MITSEEPKVSPNGRYSIGEACKALGIHRHTLQKYTENGWIKCGFRRNTYRKFYTGTEILKFWRAYA